MSDRYFQLLPLPIEIETPASKITLKKGVDLIKKSDIELANIYGYSLVGVAGQSRQYREVDERAPFKWIVDPSYGGARLPVVEWPWFLRYSPMTEGMDQLEDYFIAILKVILNTRVDSPCSITFKIRGKPGGGTVKDDVLVETSLHKMNINDIKKIRVILGSYSEEKMDIATRLMAATRYSRNRTAAYIAELIGILDSIYGNENEIKYRLRVNFMLAHSELATNENWNLLGEAYKIRCRHSHGTEIKDFSKIDIDKLESLVCAAILKLFTFGKCYIDQLISEEALVLKLSKG